MSIVASEIDWHDGILVDVRLTGLAEHAQRLVLAVDLYPNRDAKTLRQRYVCVGENLSRFLVSADIARLIENRSAGNIDSMRVDFTANSEILVVSLFGGAIEAEAVSFQLTESST